MHGDCVTSETRPFDLKTWLLNDLGQVPEHLQTYKLEFPHLQNENCNTYSLIDYWENYMGQCS